jgi:hypothetical protein
MLCIRRIDPDRMVIYMALVVANRAPGFSAIFGYL